MIAAGVLAGGLSLLAGTAGATGAPPAILASSSQPNTLVPIIVRDDPNAAASSQGLLVVLGGRVTRQFDSINGYAALVPQQAVETLRGTAGVASVTPDQKVRLTTASWDTVSPAGITDLAAGSTEPGGPGWKTTGSYSTMSEVNKLIGAQSLWNRGTAGAGVGIALIDSGTVPVDGLNGQVVNGPDLSFESQNQGRLDLDTFGHGTHMAGIMVGRDPAAVSTKQLLDAGNFVGVAPGAKAISLKVAASDGATDVSQVLAAIDWVVQHRNDPGLNIRVLNLSFGTDSIQDYRVDPLAYAVEVAWLKGIVVVVAAGNSGGSGGLNDPAFDPYVIAVGAEDMHNTPGSGDDTVPDWSSRGSSSRGPDIVAPGKSILSLRDPGSWADLNFPGAVVAGRFFRGSGTSQATAVVSGAVALLISQRPGLTPDQVKYLLMDSAKQLPKASGQAQGAGLIDVSKAASESLPAGGVAQSYPRSTGTGSLEAARGNMHVSDNGVELLGEVDIFGQAWNGRSWSGRSWSGTSWQGDSWMGRSWSGTWAGASWAGRSWSGRSWSENVWDGRSWSGRSWSADGWSGRSWSGRSWSGDWPE
jgi:serine protease AprX